MFMLLIKEFVCDVGVIFVTRMHNALKTVVESIIIFTLAILCTLAGN